MASMDRIFREFDPDVVVHFAAESHVDRSIDGPVTFLRTNIDGTFVLLECCRKYWGANRVGKRFHQVSTDEVYGSMGFEDVPKKETDAYDPSSPYSASKAAADHLVRAWGRTFDLHYTISIACNNYGPYQLPEKLIPRMICRALRREQLPVFGDGKNRREWIHVDDHVEAIWVILHEDGGTCLTYNVGSGYEIANIDLVTAICHRLAIASDAYGMFDFEEFESLIGFVPDRPGHDLRYALNSERFVRLSRNPVVVARALDGCVASAVWDFSKGGSLGEAPFGTLLPDEATGATQVRRRHGWGRTLSDGLDATVSWYLRNPGWVEAAQSGSYR
jgi:dTDP-glucose 4,6-dehydratase